jgi:uncharacterized zinc-type alcohol dehydrogenase-like protein
MSAINAWAALEAKKPLEPFSYDPGPLHPDEVEVAVDYCGISLAKVNDALAHLAAGKARYRVVLDGKS